MSTTQVVRRARAQLAAREMCRASPIEVLANGAIAIIIAWCVGASLALI